MLPKVGGAQAPPAPPGITPLIIIMAKINLVSLRSENLPLDPLSAADPSNFTKDPIPEKPPDPELEKSMNKR